MTLFFFVFGLEARREFDMGSCGTTAPALPVLAGLGGMAVPMRSTWPSTQERGPRLGRRCPPTPRSPWACCADPANSRPRARVPAVGAVVDDLVSLIVIGPLQCLRQARAAGHAVVVFGSCWL